MKSKYKGFCKGLAITVLVLGIIGSIWLAVEYGEVTKVSYSAYLGVSSKVKRDAGLTIAYLVSGLFGTVILYTILSALGEVLEYLEMQSFKKDHSIHSIATMNPPDDENEEELPPL